MSESSAAISPVQGKWYLLRAKSRQESRAEDNLRRQGYHCYCPRVTVQKIRQGRRVEFDEIMFPGYLFIWLSDCNNWSPIRSTFGVLEMVAFNGRPLVVDASIIDELQQRETIETSPRGAWARGDKLSVTQGPFRNLQAIFERFDGLERAVILLDILQQQQRITLPLSSVQPA